MNFNCFYSHPNQIIVAHLYFLTFHTLAAVDFEPVRHIGNYPEFFSELPVSSILMSSCVQVVYYLVFFRFLL